MALSIWEQRIAPVFDTARHIWLVESVAGRIEQQQCAIAGEQPSQKVAWLSAQGVETLVCGAVSRQFQKQLTMGGITVIPFIAGEVDQVIQAYFNNTLKRADFRMPGCCGRRRRTGLGCCQA